MTPEEYTALARFCELAKQGKNPAASSGERVANKLAKALHAIGDDMVLLDPVAIEGFCLLCRLASGPWMKDADKERVFETIAKAAV